MPFPSFDDYDRMVERAEEKEREEAEAKLVSDPRLDGNFPAEVNSTTQRAAAFFQGIGKRDGLAEVLMLVRANGFEAAMLEIAADVQRIDPANPHAKWALEEFKPK